MMYQAGAFKLAFVREPQMQVLELPYVDNALSMIILLPVGTATLEQVMFRNASSRGSRHACAPTCVPTPPPCVCPMTSVQPLTQPTGLQVHWHHPRACEGTGGPPGPYLQGNVFRENNLFFDIKKV